MNATSSPWAVPAEFSATTRKRYSVSGARSVRVSVTAVSSRPVVVAGVAAAVVVAPPRGPYANDTSVSSFRAFTVPWRVAPAAVTSVAASVAARGAARAVVKVRSAPTAWSALFSATTR